MQRRLLGKRGGLARKDSSKVADRRVASDGTLQRPSDLGVGTERFARRPRSLAVGATTELERLQRRSLFALYTGLFADERLPVLVYAKHRLLHATVRRGVPHGGNCRRQLHRIGAAGAHRGAYRYRRLSRGNCAPAAAPEIYVRELRTFFRSLR